MAVAVSNTQRLLLVTGLQTSLQPQHTRASTDAAVRVSSAVSSAFDPRREGCQVSVKHGKRLKQAVNL